MKATDAMRMAIEQSRGWTMGLLGDMKDAPLTAPTPNGGNHPLWNLGHLAFSEGQLFNVFMQGQPNPLEKWKDLFGQGSEPVADASAYPPFDEVAAAYDEMRAQTLAYLDGITDDDLDKPSHAPEEMKDFFGTIGQCLVAMAIHTTFHGGQVADSRRAAGRPPLMG